MRKVLLILLFACAVMTLAGMSPEARRSLGALQQRADAGDAEARFRLASLYRTGYDSIPADTTRWVSLLRLSAADGYAPAQNMLGYLYGQGTGVKADADSMRFWIRRAADAGDMNAASNAGFLLLRRADSLRADSLQAGSANSLQADSLDRVAAGYLEKSAAAGVPQAMSLLGDLAREGRGVPCDTVRAAELYTAAFQAGLRDAELRLLNMMMPRWQRTLTPAEQVSLGKEYFNAETPMPIIGVELLKLSVEAIPSGPEKGEALRMLGDAYSLGRGALYDHDLGIEYYRRAAEEGDQKAAEIIDELLQIFPDAL